MYIDNSIWKELSKFQSSSISQKYLCNCYEKLGIADYEKLSYQNCFPFIYYLEHGEKYYRQLQTTPLELYPILLFYGMVQLLKAAILTRDPLYPENSQVLAHGVSTRKRKKTQYLFLEDEVKLQKNGLLTHFSDKLFHVKQIPSEKYNMRQLLRQIPEIHDLFFYSERKLSSYKIKKVNNTTLLIPNKILNDFHLSLDGFSHYLLNRTELKINNLYEKEPYIEVHLKQLPSALNAKPFLFHLDGSFYLLRNRDTYLDLPEIVTHYLILYNLSMICRYETEWWGDLFHHYPESDFPFIKEFLHVTKEKIPYLLFQFLNEGF